jgi:hypothetical protein
MRGSKGVKQFCRTLTGLQASIATYGEGLDEFLLSHGYPSDYKQIADIRRDLEELGMYDEVLAAVQNSEKLVREGNYREAEMLVLNINRKLAKASGAEEDLRRMYRAANE